MSHAPTTPVLFMSIEQIIIIKINKKTVKIAIKICFFKKVTRSRKERDRQDYSPVNVVCHQPGQRSWLSELKIRWLFDAGCQFYFVLFRTMRIFCFVKTTEIKYYRFYLGFNSYMFWKFYPNSGWNISLFWLTCEFFSNFEIIFFWFCVCIV